MGLGGGYADHAREVGAVLELSQQHGEEEGAGHEHKGEEGCVGQGSLRFGHHCHVVLIMLLQWVVLEDLQQRTKASYFLSSIRHPSTNLSVIYLSIHLSPIHPSTYLLPQLTG